MSAPASTAESKYIFYGGQNLNSSCSGLRWYIIKLCLLLFMHYCNDNVCLGAKEQNNNCVIFNMI